LVALPQDLPDGDLHNARQRQRAAVRPAGEHARLFQRRQRLRELALQRLHLGQLAGDHQVDERVLGLPGGACGGAQSLNCFGGVALHDGHQAAIEPGNALQQRVVGRRLF
jgi:hypothetical protein